MPDDLDQKKLGLPENKEVTLLLVEPQEQMRRSQIRIFQQLGFEKTVVATTGTEAWSILKGKGADLVISGWYMPEMSGLALLKVVRSDNELAQLPFILVADRVTKSQVIEAGEAGVTDMICLPLTPHTVQRKVENALLSGQDPQSREAELQYQRGLELMKAGRWEEALEAFKSILDIFESAEVYYNMGYISTAQGRYEEAIRYFRKATQINSAFARAYQKMGEVYIKLGRHKLAQQAFEQAAELYMAKDMDENAEAILQQVLKLNPNTINVYNSLGILYRRQGKFEKALDQYKKALKVNPNNENIYYNMGRIYFETKRYEEARSTFNQALKINPEFAEAEDMVRTIDIRLNQPSST